MLLNIRTYLNYFSFYFIPAPVARMLKFYNLPLLTAGGLANDYSNPKGSPTDEYHLLTRTGFSFNRVTQVVLDLFQKYVSHNITINSFILWYIIPLATHGTVPF